MEYGDHAVLYLVEHTDKLGIGPHTIVANGFSAGGNLTFSTPLKFNEIIRTQAPVDAEEHRKEGGRIPCH